MSSSFITDIIDSVFEDLDNKFEEVKNEYEGDFEDKKNEFIEFETNHDSNEYMYEEYFTGFDIMSNYHRVIKFVNQEHSDNYGENIDIDIILNPHKLQMYLLYWIGQNWKWDKNEYEVYVGNGEWQVVDNLNELNDLIGSDIEVNDSDSDYEEEEEVRCVCDKCFGEGMCYVSKERARELERLELMESECPYGDKCEGK